MTFFGRPISQRREKSVLFSLKLANLAATVLYQFVLIAALVRTLGADLYPTMILLIAIGNYVLNSDIGFSSYAYAKLRRDYVVRDGHRDQAFISVSLTIYAYITVVSVLLMGLYVSLEMDQAAATKLAILIFFSVVVLGLPWRLLLKIATALDLYLAIEVIEFARRAGVLLLATLMLVGLPFFLFSALSLAVWTAIFCVAFAVLRRRGVSVRLAPFSAAIRFFVDERQHIFATGGFSGLEFLIYNFPYLALPALSLGPAAIVLFDLFFKVTRFGGIAYKVPVETLLPFQTRAYHAHEIGNVTRLHLKMILVNILIFVAAALFLYWFGIAFFEMLIDRIVPVEASLIYLMIAMMFVSIVQVPATIFLVSIGAFGTLLKVSATGLAMTSAAILATLVLDLEFIGFLAFYVGAYGLFSLVYQIALVIVLRRGRKG